LPCLKGSAQGFAADHLDLTFWPNRREVQIALPDQSLLLYSFATNLTQPAILEFHTFQGYNILASTQEPSQMLPGIGYDLTIDDLSFSGTTTNSGRQVAEPTLSRTVRARSPTSPESEISQTIYWLRPGYSPNRPLEDQALLVEQRTLTLSLRRAQELSTLQWRSTFTAPQATAPVQLSSRIDQGLRLRLHAETNTIIRFINTPALSLEEDSVEPQTPDPWIAVRVSDESGDYTAAVFPHPATPGDPVMYYVTQPSPFLSVGQDFGPQPFELEAGESFEVRYLIMLYSAHTSAEIIGKQYRRWVTSEPFP